MVLSRSARALPALLLLAAVATGVAAADAPAAPQRSSYWRERTSLFATLQRHAEVVMVGDSLTDGAEWAELFPGRSIANRGIDGDTVDGVLARLDTILALRPRLAFIMLGINDFADGKREVDAVFADYRNLVARLQQAGVQVVVQSTLPCNEAKGQWKSCAALNGRIAALDARLATLASARVRFVDLRPLLAPQGQLMTEYTIDGIHLNGEGYRRWQRAIAPFMPAQGRRRDPQR
ncbi:GDSL-type esterase/lipase family protein [Caenimonas terrae]|uniref:GDSL-type esterase/lipase family protein n=1 Tax=Caenimonas terrae TaxID=696074 RepID=A0ABW0NCQ9_9BURK